MNATAAAMTTRPSNTQPDPLSSRTTLELRAILAALHTRAATGAYQGLDLSLEISRIQRLIDERSPRGQRRTLRVR